MSEYDVAPWKWPLIAGTLGPGMVFGYRAGHDAARPSRTRR